MKNKLVFLTHQFDDVERIALHKLFDALMFSVEPFYTRLRLSDYSRIRDLLGFNCRVAYDSGGFAFLIGRVKEPPNPYKTIQLYKCLGYTDDDFLIQLDLPPQYFMPPDERRSLIVKSAEYYWLMKHELESSRLLGVVHGWTEEELKLSLSLLEDPDRLAFGCNFSTIKPYAHDYIQKKVALGSYNVKTVLGEVVATPSCMAESKGLCPAGAPSLALASYANTKNSIAWSKKQQRVPRDVVYDRLCTAMNLLRDREIFVLGGSGPNTAHLLFLLGARYIDGASWRLAAKLWRIYVPGLGEFSVGEKRIAKRLNHQAINVIREHYDEGIFGLSFNEFLAKITANSGGFELRALWNAYVLKVEEKIANEYACDPDRYYAYLKRRWSNSSYWLQVLDFCWRRTRKPYVQPKLEVYIKAQLGR